MKKLFLLLGLLFFSCGSFAADSISISFVGPDSIHIKYHADSYSDPVYLAQTDNGLTVIKQVNGSGIYQYLPNANNYYKFELGTNQSGWVTLAATSSINFQGNSLYGYMLFNETINLPGANIIPGNVIVPSGLKLSLKSCNLDNDSLGMTDFIVTGKVEITKNITYDNSSWIDYHFFSKQDLDGCEGGNFFFKNGSDNSTFKNAKDVYVYAYSLVELSDVSNTWANIYCCDDADVTVNDSILNNILVTGAYSEATINNSTIAGQCFISNATVTSFRSSYPALNNSVKMIGNAEFTSQDDYIYKLNINAPGGSCIMTGSTNSSLVISSLNNGTFNDGFFLNSSISSALNSSLNFDGCSFCGTTGIGNTPANFYNCDFGGNTTVYLPCKAQIKDNQFFNTLYISLQSDTSDMPLIEDNSFWYKNAITINREDSLTNTPVKIGKNYFGSPDGPVISDNFYSSEVPMFTCRGGFIKPDYGALDISPEQLTKGNYRENENMPVSLWCISDRYGQGTIDHNSTPEWRSLCMQGRETAYIVDVGINQKKMAGIEFRAEFDGKFIYPTRGKSITIQRDYSDIGSIKQELAQNTVNFILPPVYTNRTYVRVYYRLPGSTNYHYLSAKAISLNAEYKNKLDLNIVPIELHAWGYPGGAPKPAAFANEFLNVMSAKVAMPKKNISIRYMHKPYNYYGVFGSLSLTYLLNDIALQLSSGRAFIKCCDLISGKKVLTDYTIVQFVDGALLNSGVDGASVMINRKILFTDGNTDALLHEFGHALGLYTSQEQYDSYPKFGLRDVGFSAFVNEPVNLPGFFGEKIDGIRRLRHFPNSNVYWYAEKNSFDIMGGKPKGAAADFWPIIDTARSFYQGFDNILNTTAKTKYSKSIVPDGTRRIYLIGKTGRISAGEYRYNYLLPDSVDVMDITEYSTRTEAGPVPWHGDFKYLFQGFDSTGGVVYSENFRCGTDSIYAMGSHIVQGWYRTFDVPESAVKYTITDKQGNLPVSDFYNQIIWEATAGGEINTEITSPAPGDEIDKDFSLKWNTTCSKNKVNGSPAENLRHIVWASTDGGASWDAQSFMISSDNLNFSYDNISAGTNIMFRVISSDGFSSHSEILSGITIKPHPPSVDIISPINNSYGTTGTVWELSAAIFDIDGNTNFSVEWYSSIDGFLGNSVSTSVYLSAGSHDIICNAIDSEAKFSSATVNVEVTPGVNYELGSNSLWLCSANVGPYAGKCVTIHTNTELTVVFNMIVPGGSSYIKARITMKSPDDGTTVLATPSWTNLTEFSTLSHEINVTPMQWGTYTFSVELIELFPDDSVPGGTTYSVSCSTVTPPKASAPNDGIVNFGYQAEADIPTGMVVFVYNDGGETLNIGQLSIGGKFATAFSMENDLLSLSSLNPGETGTVEIVFNPTFTGHNQAYLSLPCNDPSRDAHSLNLCGDYLVPEPCLFIIYYLSFIIYYRRKI